MKRVLLVLAFLVAISVTSYAQNFEMECTPASASVSLRYDNNMNPIVTGNISNGSGCVWNGDRTIYKGNGKTITGVLVHMNYSNNRGMDKVAQVSISPNSKGSFSVSFPRHTEGCTAYLYSVQGVRFSDGSFYRFSPPHNGSLQ